MEHRRHRQHRGPREARTPARLVVAFAVVGFVTLAVAAGIATLRFNGRGRADCTATAACYVARSFRVC